WSMLVASLVGWFTLARRNPRTALVLWSFPMVYYAVAGKGLTVFLRYMIPVVPFLCISAAVSVIDLADLMARGRSIFMKNGATLVLACLIVLPSAQNVSRSDSLLNRPDSRLLAANWAQAHLEGHGSVYQTGGWERLQLPETRESLKRS